MNKNSWSMGYLSGLVLFFQFALSATATAALISVGTSFGPDTATLDSETQQQWLDLSVSRPFSYNDVVAGLNPGEQFEGYRLASTAEVSDFISNSGIIALSGTPAYTGFQAFIDTIGANLGIFDLSGNGCALAFWGVSGGMGVEGAPTAGAINVRGTGGPGEPSADCLTSTPVMSMNGLSPTGLFLSAGQFNIPLDFVDISPSPGETRQFPVVGAWLVQDVTAVSAPSSLMLSLLGLLALIRVAPWHRRSGDPTPVNRTI